MNKEMASVPSLPLISSLNKAKIPSIPARLDKSLFIRFAFNTILQGRILIVESELLIWHHKAEMKQIRAEVHSFLFENACVFDDRFL